ncbi:Fis family transcriptional regulator [Xanthomonas oryzae]|uniref:HNH endonuclease signature motif containing protein n=1 Tax=Xanthomonas oryzae TaxID=347 RepID=UPI0006C28FE7|nr:HNH endonuclease signature motif containing protein [Xanthomonas oryzae]KOR44999.1 Fis family transcriptional regulator [Xanthomonas oryzae]
MSENNALTFEEASKLLSYDSETGQLTWKVAKARRIAVGDVAGCPASGGYLQVRVHGKQYLAHRLAWLLSTGNWPSQHLDHIDGCKTNNKIDNLRECSNAENHQNKGKYKNNTSGVPGVFWDKHAKKWKARIRVQGKLIHLGYFDTLEEAAQARAAAKARYHTFQPTDR